jgi:hypothetical protein
MTNRLAFIRNSSKIQNQVAKRMAKRSEIIQHANDHEQVGKHIYLTGSLPGSAPYEKRLIEDAMCIGQRYGKPTFFITMTANPEWPEIKAALHPHQQPAHTPDIIMRVFNIKYKALLHDLRSGAIIGKKSRLYHERHRVPEKGPTTLP